MDSEKAITMALVHDMDEIFSGDILSPFKHHSKEVNDAIRRVNRASIKEVFRDLPPRLARHYERLWNEESESKTLEAQIVKMADRLTLLAKCGEEIEGGNEFFREIYDRVYKKLQEDTLSWWEQIKKEVIG